MVDNVFDIQEGIIPDKTIGNTGFDFCLNDFEDTVRKKSQGYSDGHFSICSLLTVTAIVYEYKKNIYY